MSSFVVQVKGGVSEGDFKFKLVTVGDSGVLELSRPWAAMLVIYEKTEPMMSGFKGEDRHVVVVTLVCFLGLAQVRSFPLLVLACLRFTYPGACLMSFAQMVT